MKKLILIISFIIFSITISACQNQNVTETDNSISINNNELHISKRVNKNSFPDIDASGYLKPLNYEAPENWSTIFYIHFFNNSYYNEPSFFYAREIVILGNDIITTDLKEYEIIKMNENHIIATDNIYTFEITENDIFITDKDGQKSKLIDKSIKLNN